jgi:hypothetical protein
VRGGLVVSGSALSLEVIKTNSWDTEDKGYRCFESHGRIMLGALRIAGDRGKMAKTQPGAWRTEEMGKGINRQRTN